MPFRKKTFRKKPMYRKKSTKMVKSVQSNVHSFRQTAASLNLQGNAAYAPYLAASSFPLAGVAQVASFQALFDQYKISHIQLRFMLRVDPSAQTAATATYPRLYYARDYNDLNLPASLNELREYSKCKIVHLKPDRTTVVNLKPAVLQEMYKSAVTTGYSPKWKQWISMADTTVPHYGLKWGVDLFTNTNYWLDVETVYWFQCKNVK